MYCAAVVQVGVDLFHCEKQAAAIVAESHGAVMELHGELLSNHYFDSIAAEIDDLLQVRESACACACACAGGFSGF